MRLEIVTPDKKVFEGEASSVTLPGVDGSFQLLENHAPIVSTLKKGIVTVQSNASTETIEVNGGVVEVNNNKVIVLAE
jgi:F-type H+-transporting ATPase subunit epsilon